jgi:hypothetical protein
MFLMNTSLRAIYKNWVNKLVAKPTLLLLCSFTLLSCGTSYVVPRAIIHVEVQNLDNVQQTLTDFLLTKEFNERLVDNKLEKLLAEKHKDTSAEQSNPNDYLLKRKYLIRRFKNDILDLSVEFIDYSDPKIKSRFVNYENTLNPISEQPILEINIYNYRPGGFSPEAHLFFSDLKNVVDKHYPKSSYIVFPPPRTNHSEYYSTKLVNFMALAFWWLVAFGIYVSFSGFIALQIIKRTRLSKLSTVTQRILFIVPNVALATPLPIGGVAIMFLYLPSMFAWPDIGNGYFTQMSMFVVPSFIASTVICCWLSTRYFKSQSTRSDKSNLNKNNH